jgi:pimeloyl-ACP methyl ester carboxylesterase
MTLCKAEPVLLALSVAVSNTLGAALPVSTPNFPPPTFDGIVDVGGHKLRMVTYGQGTPAVVIEAGGSQAGVENIDWKPVIDDIAKTTRICVYDRANLGASDATPTQWRTSQDIAKDLHALLRAAKILGPYILVGHSVGGLNVRLYAKQYADEVAGVVLVDASHPDQMSKLLAALPAESPDEHEDIKATRKSIIAENTDPSFNRERFDPVASAAQVRAAGTLGDKPLVVLTRNPKAYEQNPIQRRLLEPVWQELQRDLSRLSSNSTHKVATKAGHFIQVNEPQLVIDAIRQIVDAGKKRNKP